MNPSLTATIDARGANKPYFSICIPQYNRTDFLIEALRSFSVQTFRDFEVCVSDGGSTDGGFPRIEEFLNTSGLRYLLSPASNQLRYDANLRRSISLSSGRYVLLMGNDDALSDKDTLDALHRELDIRQPIAAAITNYQELPSKRQYRRMTMTGVVGAGVRTAAETFRHYSFVSGIIFDGQRARAAATDACDGGEMYQMYLGSRLVAEGGRFLSIDRVCIDKDIQVPGQVVDSYSTRERIYPCPIESRPLPMGRILETVALGLQSACEGEECDRALARVARQLYIFSYPYWIFEYRRVQSYNYALGVYFALRPSWTTRKAKLRLLDYLFAWSLYIGVGAIAFIVPLRLFDAMKSRLYAVAKRPLRLAATAKNEG